MTGEQKRHYVIAVLVTCEELLERLKLPTGHKIQSVAIELRRERKRIETAADIEEALL